MGHRLPGVFVVSLNDDTRNPSILQQLSSKGFRPEVLRAFDYRDVVPSNVSPEIDPLAFTHIVGRLPSGPELGCALSHRQAARQARNRGLEYVAVFEDDAMLEGDIQAVAEWFLEKSFSRPAIMMFFSNEPALFRRNKRYVLSQDPSLVVGQLHTPTSSTAGYILNSQAISLLAEERPVAGLADWPPAAYAADFWATTPFLVNHLGFDSDIEESRQRLSSRPSNHEVMQALRRYLRLFHPRRAIIHARELGSWKSYWRRVVVAHTTQNFAILARRIGKLAAS